MYLSKKVLEDTVEKTTGKDTIPLVNALKNKKDVSEFSLASSIKRDIYETRNMLYKLYNQNLVSSTRKKDKKKGWYVYYWTLNTNRMKFLAEKSKDLYMENLKQKLDMEKDGDFYACGNTCNRVDFERASDLQFKCSECGTLLYKTDNSKIIKELEKKIKAM